MRKGLLQKSPKILSKTAINNFVSFETPTHFSSIGNRNRVLRTVR